MAKITENKKPRPGSFYNKVPYNKATYDLRQDHGNLSWSNDFISVHYSHHYDGYSLCSSMRIIEELDPRLGTRPAWEQEVRKSKRAAMRRARQLGIKYGCHVVMCVETDEYYTAVRIDSEGYARPNPLEASYNDGRVQTIEEAEAYRDKINEKYPWNGFNAIVKVIGKHWEVVKTTCDHAYMLTSQGPTANCQICGEENPKIYLTKEQIDVFSS